MYHVGIVFNNGSKAAFFAEEFDVDLSRSGGQGDYDQVRKLTYKNTNGEETPIYLNPSEVAGVAVVNVSQYSETLQIS